MKLFRQLVTMIFLVALSPLIVVVALDMRMNERRRHRIGNGYGAYPFGRYGL